MAGRSNQTMRGKQGRESKQERCCRPRKAARTRDQGSGLSKMAELNRNQAGGS